MAEKRKFTASICVKIDAITAQKIETFPSEQWDASVIGLFRLRINRRWLDLPEGGSAYFTRARIGELTAAMMVGGTLPEPAMRPDLPRGSSVGVPCRTLAGVQLYEITRTGTEPICGHDGRWYVHVHLLGQGNKFVPVDSLKIKEGQ